MTTTKHTFILSDEELDNIKEGHEITITLENTSSDKTVIVIKNKE